MTVIGPHVARHPTILRQPIEVDRAVACVLFALAHNCRLREAGQFFGMGESTVSSYMYTICPIIKTYLGAVYLKTPSEAEFQNIMEGFWALSGLHLVAGAIDGCHIRLAESPPKQFHPHDYYNRKRYHSMLLQGVVDSRCRFWDVCVDAPGSVHDNTHFKRSGLYRALQHRAIMRGPSMVMSGVEVLPYIVGDAAYALTPFCQKAWGGSAGDSFEELQVAYDRTFNRCRVKIENAFGLLKQKWRILDWGVRLRIDHAASVIYACCVLHNFLLSCGELTDEDIEEEERFIRERLEGGRTEEDAMYIEPDDVEVQNEQELRAAGQLVQKALFLEFCNVETLTL